MLHGNENGLLPECGKCFVFTLVFSKLPPTSIVVFDQTSNDSSFLSEPHNSLTQGRHNRINASFIIRCLKSKSIAEDVYVWKHYLKKNVMVAFTCYGCVCLSFNITNIFQMCNDILRNWK